MPATTMMTRALVDARAFGQEPVKAGNADVVQPVDVVAHDLGGDRRFLCHWYVRSSRRGDQYDALTTRHVDSPLDDPGLFVETGVRHEFRYFAERGAIRPGDEQAVSTHDDGVGDPGDLVGGLALSEDRLPGIPVVVRGRDRHGRTPGLRWRRPPGRSRPDARRRRRSVRRPRRRRGSRAGSPTRPVVDETRRRVRHGLVDSVETSFLELRVVHAVPWPIL